MRERKMKVKVEKGYYKELHVHYSMLQKLKNKSRENLIWMQSNLTLGKNW
jgi:hypothetical protein